MNIKDGFNFNSRGPDYGEVKRLVILLHGFGTNGSFMDMVADEVLKELPDSFVIMPDAPEPFSAPRTTDGTPQKVPDFLERPAFKKGKHDQRQWFSIVADDRMDYHSRALNVAKRLNEFIDNKRDMLGLTDQDVAIMGFSQGGVVALYTAYSRDNPVSCVVGHSAPFLSDEGMKTKLPTLYLYGVEDEEISRSRYASYIAAVKAYAGDLLTVHQENSLKSHKTSAETRRVVARFIGLKMAS